VDVGDEKFCGKLKRGLPIDVVKMIDHLEQGSML
jgi:hypothetical protein